MIKTLTFNNGLKIPSIGLGTWKIKPNETYDVVRFAIEKAGYRHIDCALIYDNEEEVGKAIKSVIEERIVKRDDLFVTSKLWHTFHSRKKVIEACRISLSNIGLSYLDLYLIHAPFGTREGTNNMWETDDSGVDYLETWQGMEDCVSAGLTKSIGLSNFNSEQIKRILSVCNVKPVTNQVECHPYFNQSKLIEFCSTHGILVTAYSPLGSSDRPWAKKTDESLLSNLVLKEIAIKHKKSIAQIALRFQVQRGVIAVPKSATPSHIRENIEIFDFQLSDDDMNSIATVDKNHRLFLFNPFANHKYFPFTIPF